MLAAPPDFPRYDENLRQQIAAIFDALSHPARLRMVELLLGGERTVGDIADALSLQQSSTSQHLAVLARAGVLVARSEGAARFYRVRGPRIRQILTLTDEFCRRHELEEPD